MYESRLLKRLAKENNVVTQMGNQGHSREGTRRIVEWVRSGIIGDIREVHIFTDRPARFWAQGLPRPARAGVVQTGTTAAPAPVMTRGNVGQMRSALAAATEAQGFQHLEVALNTDVEVLEVLAHDHEVDAFRVSQRAAHARQLAPC